MMIEENERLIGDIFPLRIKEDELIIDPSVARFAFNQKGEFEPEDGRRQFILAIQKALE